MTPSVHLRRPAETDLADYLAYRNDPDAMAAQSLEAIDDVAARDFLRHQALRRDDEPGWQMFAVEKRNIPGLIGEVGVFRSEREPMQGNIGWWMHPGHRRQGHALEAASLLIDWCFDERDLHRLTANCLATNTASQNLMRRLGMRLEQMSVEGRLSNGIWQDEVGYALLRREWAAGRAGR